jgi:hypothetical protein
MFSTPPPSSCCGYSGFRERLLADPSFLVKLAIECGIGICTKCTAEYAKRQGTFSKVSRGPTRHGGGGVLLRVAECGSVGQMHHVHCTVRAECQGTFSKGQGTGAAGSVTALAAMAPTQACRAYAHMAQATADADTLPTFCAVGVRRILTPILSQPLVLFMCAGA